MQPAINFIKEFFGFGKKAVTSVTLDLDLPPEITADTEKAVEAMEDLRHAISVFTDESIKQAAKLRRSTLQFSGGALKKFAHGGAFSVAGTGGIDSQLVQFMASPGETVTVTPEGGGDGSTFNIDARGAGLGVERRIQRAMQQAIKTARMQSGNDFAAALSGAGA